MQPASFSLKASGVVSVLGRFSGLSPWARASNLLLPMVPCDIRDECVCWSAKTPKILGHRSTTCGPKHPPVIWSIDCILVDFYGLLTWWLDCHTSQGFDATVAWSCVKRLPLCGSDKSPCFLSYFRVKKSRKVFFLTLAMAFTARISLI
jgi:hypothetical protein